MGQKRNISDPDLFVTSMTSDFILSTCPLDRRDDDDVEIREIEMREQFFALAEFPIAQCFFQP